MEEWEEMGVFLGLSRVSGWFDSPWGIPRLNRLLVTPKNRQNHKIFAPLAMPITGVAHDRPSHNLRPTCEAPDLSEESPSPPEGLSQADVLTVVLAITGIGAVVFRKIANARIG